MSARGTSRTLPDQGGNLGSSPGARSICVPSIQTARRAWQRQLKGRQVGVCAASKRDLDEELRRVALREHEPRR